VDVILNMKDANRSMKDLPHLFVDEVIKQSVHHITEQRNERPHQVGLFVDRVIREGMCHVVSPNEKHSLQTIQMSACRRKRADSGSLDSELPLASNMNEQISSHTIASGGLVETACRQCDIGVASSPQVKFKCTTGNIYSPTSSTSSCIPSSSSSSDSESDDSNDTVDTGSDDTVDTDTDDTDTHSDDDNTLPSLDSQKVSQSKNQCNDKLNSDSLSPLGISQVSLLPSAEPTRNVGERLCNQRIGHVRARKSDPPRPMIASVTPGRRVSMTCLSGRPETLPVVKNVTSSLCGTNSYTGNNSSVSGSNGLSGSSSVKCLPSKDSDIIPRPGNSRSGRRQSVASIAGLGVLVNKTRPSTTGAGRRPSVTHITPPLSSRPAPTARMGRRATLSKLSQPITPSARKVSKPPLRPQQEERENTCAVAHLSLNEVLLVHKCARKFMRSIRKGSSAAVQVFSGPKLFWRLRCSVVVTVFEHEDNDCFEIITTDVDNKLMFPRLYVRPSLVYKLKMEDFQSKLRSIYESRRDLLDRAQRTCAAEFIVDTLAVDLSTTLPDRVNLTLKRLGENGEHESINIAKPADVMPVHLT